jgi:hypothetical protein
MRRWVAIGLVIGALCAGAPAASLAQAAAPPAVSAKSEALVRRYLKAIHFERLMDTMISAMLPVMSDQVAQQHPSLTSEQRAMISEVVRDTMREDLMPKMLEKMVPIYAQTFTESELEAIVAFYETPVGQSMIEKTPSLAPKSAEVVRELMPEMQKDVLIRLCARITCPQAPAAAPPKPNKS